MIITNFPYRHHRLPHPPSVNAIVVLSEMYTFVDWRAIAAAAAKASDSEAHRALFHVLDIQELTKLAANCKDSETLSNRLTQRWLFVQEKGTAYVRAKSPV
jgi:hypothetical protein